jgi:hypothetical protein
MPRFPAAAALAAVLIAAPAAQEVRTERVVIRPALPYVHDAGRQPDSLIVKFDDRHRVRLRGQQLVAVDGGDVDSVREALGTARIERLFSRSEDDLDRERAELQPRVPPGEPPLADLNNYYRVRTTGIAQTVQLTNALNRLDAIETCYPEPIAVPAGDIPPPTPLFESQQNWLGPAPAAFGYLPLQSVVGMRSPDNRVAHLEGDWHLGHEDQSDLIAANVIGLQPVSFGTWRDHGTACVGILAANRNGWGMRGMASDTRRLYLSSLENGAANMVSLVTAVLGAGDVMTSSFAWLLQQQYQAPLDYEQASYDAVRAAATKGIHYVFVAGNTGQDLTNTAIYGDRYLPTSASSGGYIVAATDPGASGRVAWSNFGPTHVITNGWGSGVATLGYGTLFDPGDVRQRYTAAFAGTSAAAPQVAGVIAAYVGAVRAQTGQILSVAQVKNALRTTGNPVGGNIGNRPDLGQLLALHGLPDALLVTEDAPPGGFFRYELSGNGGEAFGAFISIGRGSAQIGLNRPFLLDTSVLLYLGGGVIDLSGKKTLSMRIPNNPSLLDSEWYLQALLDRGGVLHLSSSASLWVH